MESTTRNRLEEFRGRRNRLLIVRGIAIVLLVLLLGATATAIIESIFGDAIGLTTWPTWLLYFVAFLTAIACIARPLWRGQSLWWNAAQIESLEPKLRDRLLAALDLDQQEQRAKRQSNAQDTHSRLGSKAFRDAAQRSVARRIESINIRDLLPWRRVQLWPLALAVSTVVVAALCLIPGLHLPNRLARVLLPMVDVGRVDEVAISLQELSIGKLVPEDEPLNIRAQILGKIAAEPFLEFESIPRSAESPAEQVAMFPLDGDFPLNGEFKSGIYQVHWTPSRGRSRFRVRSGNAFSAWKEIETAARPRVDQFRIEYQFPAYARLPSQVIDANHGDLQAIVDTMAVVSMKANQDQVSGEVVIRARDRTRVADNADVHLPLAHFGDGWLQVSIPIKYLATYRVELIASQSGLENSFSPTYQIVPSDDLPPQVRWQKPTKFNFAVRPDELLDFEIYSEDEIPLESMELRVRSQAGDWNAIPMAPPPEKSGLTPVALDLMTLASKPGDLVQIQVVATDRNKQSTTSETIDLYISSMSIDEADRAELEKRASLVGMLDGYSATLRQQALNVSMSIEAQRADPASDLLKQKSRSALEQAKALIEQQTNAIQAEVLNQLKSINDTVDSEEYELLARSLVPHQFAPVSETGDLESLADEADAIAAAAREFVSHDVISHAGKQLRTLYQYQQELQNSKEKLRPEQYQRRQALVASQLQDLADLLREQLPTLKNRAKKSAGEWTSWLDSQASKIREATGDVTKPDSKPMSTVEANRLGDQVLKELRSHQNVGNIDSELAASQVKARQVLQDRLKDRPSSTKQPSKELAEEVARRESAVALNDLALRREVQQVRTDGDPQFIADLGQTARAFTRLDPALRRNEPEAVQSKNQLDAVYSSLESMHELQHAMHTLDQLHAIERWEAGSLQAQFEQPRKWEDLQQSLSTLAEQFDGNDSTKAAAEMLRSLQSSQTAKQVGEKIDPRRWSSNSLASAAPELESMQASLKQVWDSLEPTRQAARELLDDLSPSVSELARQAAADISESELMSRGLFADVKNDEVPDLHPRLESIESQWKNRQPILKSLREGLSDLASRQDILNAYAAKIARDSDAAISLVHRIQHDIDESMAQIRDQKDIKQNLLEALADSSDLQATAAETLEKIARHFELLASQSDEDQNAAEAPTAPSESNLAESLEENQAMDEAHDEADRLRRLASLDPRRVLAELEKELKQNIPMQNELSQIAKDAVADATETLEFTADQEGRLQTELENSDDKFAELKNELIQAMKRAAVSSRYVTDKKSPRIRNAAGFTLLPELTKAAEHLERELSRATGEADSLTMSNTSAEIVAEAEEFAKSLELYSRLTSRQAATFDEKSNAPIAVSEPQRAYYRREMEQLQTRYRDEDIKNGFDIERERQTELRQATSDANAVQKDLEHQTRQVEAVKKQLNNRPNSPELQANLDEIAAKVASKAAALATLKQAESMARERLEKAKAKREAIQLKTTQPFHTENPPAELGTRLALDAAEAAKQIADDLKSSLDKFRSGGGNEAAIDSVASAIEDQQSLLEGVDAAAESLGRAARHEERLANNDGSKLLQEQSQMVNEVSKTSMKAASDQLQKASPSSRSPSKISETASQEIGKSLAKAENELRQQAAALSKATGNAMNNSKASPSPMRTSEAPTKEPTLSPQELARMLDELDHLLNLQSNSEQSSSGQKNTKSAASKTKAGESSGPGKSSQASSEETSQTLSEAANQLTSQMNQQRQAMESSSQSMSPSGSTQSQSRSSAQASGTTSGTVPSVEILNLEEWGKLRELSAEDSIEGSREEIPAAYRALVEQYFRALSRQSAEAVP